ncbi:hypothetical protein GTQ40_11060 [Flavobacteriaceae bacterium R38]|nr:hypothetical protein [Flavobacteriaceae bacterium R38]
MMNYEIELLKLIKNDQPIGRSKLDRAFYDLRESDPKIDNDEIFSTSWVSILSSLKEQGLVVQSNQGYILTEKGLSFLK